MGPSSLDMSIQDKQTPFGTLTYRGVMFHKNGHYWWESEPPSEDYPRWWAHFWWKEIPLTGCGINLSYTPVNSKWYVSVAPFVAGEFPVVEDDWLIVLDSEEEAVSWVGRGLRNLKWRLVKSLDALLNGDEPSQKEGDPWWDRISTDPR